MNALKSPLLDSPAQWLIILVAIIGLVLLAAQAPSVSFGVPACLLFVAIALVAIITWYFPRQFLQLILLTIPFDFQVTILSRSTLYVDLLPLFLAIPLLADLYRRRRLNALVTTPLAAYVLMAILTGMTRAQDPFWFWGFSVRLVCGLILCIAVALYKNERDLITPVLYPLFILTPYALYQISIGSLGTLYNLLNSHYVMQPWTGRAYSFFFQPNNWGGYCAITALLAIVLFLLPHTPRDRTLAVPLIACAGVGMVTSGSRGAWMGFAAGLLCILFLTNASKLARTIAACFTVITVAAAFSTGTFTNRLFHVGGFIIDTRMVLWEAAWMFFRQHPIWGIGTTNFSFLLPGLVHWTYDTAAVHNLPLQIAAENGLIGLLLFFIPIGLILTRTARASSTSRHALMATGGLVAILVHGLVDYQFVSAPQYLYLFFFIVGLAVGVSPCQKSSAEC